MGCHRFGKIYKINLLRKMEQEENLEEETVEGEEEATEGEEDEEATSSEETE